MKNTSFAIFIKPFREAVPGSPIAHIQSGLDLRDLEYLTINSQRSRPETLAQFHQRTTGTPYTGKYGHISIE